MALEKKDYLVKGKGDIILLLHGLFGELSNWKSVVNHFSKTHKIIIPKIPITEIDVKNANLEDLTSFVRSFVKKLNLKPFIFMGNSLGGHIALIYSIIYPKNVKKLIG